jgi:hypothetical protein
MKSLRKKQNRENPAAQSQGSNAELSQDRQTADKSKAVERRRRKARRLKPALSLVKTDRLPKGKIRET